MPSNTISSPNVASTTVARTRVIGDDGLIAEVVRLSDDGRQYTLRLNDGRQVVVPADVLVARDDETFYLPLSADALAGRPGQSDAARLPIRRDVTPSGTSAAAEIDREVDAGDHHVVPVVEEQVTVGTRQVVRGTVRIVKTVREEEQTYDQPLMREEVEVERIAKEEFVQRAAEPRYEGDTLVIPLYEEVLVVEKRLMLREEVRVRRNQTLRTDAVPVTVRKEEVRIEREPAEGLTPS